VRALQTTAERLLAAHQEAKQLGKELAALARAMAPTLLAQPGVGPVTAAQILISWSHPGRLRSEPPSPCSPAPHPSRPPPAR
jgi:transposase